MRGEIIMPAGPASPPDSHSDEVYDDGLLRIEYAGFYVECAGQPHYALARKEFFILACLARNAGRIVTHATLWSAAWSPGKELNAHTLRVHIATLRRKLAPFGVDIHSVVHFGYRLNPPVKAKAGSDSAL
jgi:two-component system response regulator MprA